MANVPKTYGVLRSLKLTLCLPEVLDAREFRHYWQNPWRLGGPAPTLDELGQVRDSELLRDGEPCPEIVPEAETELGTGLGQAEEGVPAIAAHVAAGSAAHLAPGDLGPDVVLRSIGVQRDLRAIEHPEQLRLVGVQPREQPVQDDKAGPPPKDPIKPHAQFAPSSRDWLSPVSLEVTVEPPDQRSQVLLRPALVIGEGLELVHEALGVHPAQRMAPHQKLARIVADDHRLGQEAVGFDRTPERALGGDAHRIGTDLQIGDTKPFKMGLPGRPTREGPPRMSCQPLNHRPG